MIIDKKAETDLLVDTCLGIVSLSEICLEKMSTFPDLDEEDDEIVDECELVRLTFATGIIFEMLYELADRARMLLADGDPLKSMIINASECADMLETSLCKSGTILSREHKKWFENLIDYHLQPLFAVAMEKFQEDD